MRIFKFAVCFFLALTLQAAEAEKRGLGMIRSGPAVPHIAVGGDTWSTDFDIICMANSAQPFTLSFYDSQGDAMALELYDENGQFIGSKVSHTGVVPQQGAIFLRTRNTGAVLKQGYAVLENTDSRNVGVTAIITNSFAGKRTFALQCRRSTRSIIACACPSPTPTVLIPASPSGAMRPPPRRTSKSRRWTPAEASWARRIS